jgi:hypothetical protein
MIKKNLSGDLKFEACFINLSIDKTGVIVKRLGKSRCQIKRCQTSGSKTKRPGKQEIRAD